MWNILQSVLPREVCTSHHSPLLKLFQGALPPSEEKQCAWVACHPSLLSSLLFGGTGFLAVPQTEHTCPQFNSAFAVLFILQSDFFSLTSSVWPQFLFKLFLSEVLPDDSKGELFSNYLSSDLFFS
jgi:hypothetical protein